MNELWFENASLIYLRKYFSNFHQLKKISIQRAQRISLVAHWLLVSGDHGSNPSGKETILLFICCKFKINSYGDRDKKIDRHVKYKKDRLERS